MRLAKLDQMSMVMRVLYNREFQTISSILTEETAIRGALAQLEAQISHNIETSAGNYKLQAVGAQLLWQSWTARTQSRLNTELAQVMSKKLVALDRVRIAFGRQRAVEMMISAKRSTQRIERVKRQEIHFLTGGNSLLRS